MLPNRSFLVLLVSLSSLVFAACGSGDESPAKTCDDVTCGENASCDPDTLECVCDAGFTSLDGECVDSRMVTCNDAAPDNATSVLRNVEVRWTEEAGWSAPADCEWSCKAGFGEHESRPDECLDTVEVSCNADSIPYNSNAIIEAVLVTWDDETGWSAPDTCSWQCVAGYAEHESEPGKCASELTVACVDGSPENAEPTVETVMVTWDAEALAWSDDSCPWECLPAFGPHESAPGECADELEIACVDRSPDDAEAISDTVTVSWLEAEETWSDDSCPWQCEAGFGEHESVPGACRHELDVACVDRSPENAETTAEAVAIEWDEAQQSWSDDSCPWACLPGFGEHDSLPGECHEELVVTCDDVAPDNGESTSDTVTIEWLQAEQTWSASDCPWRCLPAFGEHTSAPGECHDELTVACVDGSPANAEPTTTTVDIAWDEAEQSWSDDSCPWECDAGFGEHESVPGECHDELRVACVDRSPDNAEPTTATVDITWDEVEQTWSDNSCPWECLAGRHEEGGLCVEDQIIGWCNTQYPLHLFAPIDRESDIYSQVWVSAGTGGPERLPGISVQLCYKMGQLVSPADLDELECVPATYNTASDNNDEYMVWHAFTDAGEYEYIFIASGDGGETWHNCGVDGMGDAVVAARASVFLPRNADFRDWEDDGEGGELPAHWDVGTDLSVWRADEGCCADRGEFAQAGHVIGLERGAGSNAANELSSGLNPVQPDYVYDIHMRVYDDDPDAEVNLVYQWYNASGTSLGGAVYTSQRTVDGGEWQFLDRRVASPSDAAFLRVATRVYGQAGGQVFIEGVWIDRGAAATQTVLCRDEPPANASTTDCEALVEITWSDSDQDYTEADVCPWECDSTFVEQDGECVSTIEQEVVAGWDFVGDTTEVSVHSAANEGRHLGLEPGSRTIGFVTGAGGTGTRAASTNGWHDGAWAKYWHIEISTEGFGELTLSSQQTGSATGPRDFLIQYSLDGSSWTDLPGSTLTLVANDWDAGIFEGDLPSALDDRPSVHIRWIVTSTTSIREYDDIGSSGTSRIDNIVVSGVSIP